MKEKLAVGSEVYVKSIGRSGHIVVVCDTSEIPTKYLVEFSYPYARSVFSQDDLRST